MNLQESCKIFANCDFEGLEWEEDFPWCGCGMNCDKTEEDRAQRRMLIQVSFQFQIMSVGTVSMIACLIRELKINATGKNCGLRLRLKCDGTHAETIFRLSAKWTSPFKPAGASVQSTTGSRGVHISGSNAGYTMFRGSVKGTGYPFHSPLSPSLPLPCVTVSHHISTGFYIPRTGVSLVI